MLHDLRASAALLLLFTLLTGIAYPLLTTQAGQIFFPHRANGSLIEQNGKIIGSSLIGQAFASPKYFHSRPSAAGNGYDASNSSGSNLYPTSADLLKTVTARVDEWRVSVAGMAIPVDLVTASGSGLDPDISPAAARFQAPGIAEARGIPVIHIEQLIDENTTPPTFGVLGDKRVNVLALNRALDLLQPAAK